MMSLSQDFLELDEGKVEFKWIRRNPDNPTIIFLHEGLGCLETWKLFPEQVADKTQCNVFVYSRYGYGASGDCSLPRSVNYMHEEARILGRIIHKTGMGEIILVGHSDGASIAAIYAGDNPHAGLLGLVQIAPHYFVEDITIQSISNIRSVFRESYLRMQLQKYHGDRVDDVFWGWNDIWLNPEFFSWNISEFLEKISVPVQTIQCDDDEYGSMAQIEMARARISTNVDVCIYPACGHHPFKVCEERALADIGDFVSGVISSSGIS